MSTSRRSHLLYLAPLVVLAHIAEEAPGLLPWLNRHVDPDLTLGGFVALNAFGLLVTVTLTVATVRSRASLLGLGLIGWLSFLMLTNGALHLVACLVFREYAPGSVTAAVFYLPYFFAATVSICRDFGVRAPAAVVAAVAGAIPMLAHGISIVTVGRPLLW